MGNLCQEPKPAQEVHPPAAKPHPPAISALVDKEKALNAFLINQPKIVNPPSIVSKDTPKRRSSHQPVNSKSSDDEMFKNLSEYMKRRDKQ